MDTLLITSSNMVYASAYFSQELLIEKKIAHETLRLQLIKEERQLFDELMKRDLLQKDSNQCYRPNIYFRRYWSDTFKTHNLSQWATFTNEMVEDSIKNFAPQFCNLTISENNVIFSAYYFPEQTHFGIYNVIGDKKIYWGYLTSEKGTNIYLSPFQVFNENEEKNAQPQFLHVRSPIIIYNDAFQHIPETTFKKGKDYFKEPLIFEKLKEQFKENIVPQLKDKNTLPVYDCIGITLDQTYKMISAYDQEQQRLAEKAFKKDYAHHYLSLSEKKT